MKFNTTNAFIQRMALPPNIYYDPIPLTDVQVGFSIKRQYPSDISYQPAFLLSGQPNNVAVFWVVYRSTLERPNGRIPITVRVAEKDLYLINHDDYDFGDENSPTKASAEFSRKTRKPIELESIDEFFHDPASNQFLNKDGRVVDPVEILDTIFRQHCETIHLFKGISFRTKIAARDSLYLLLGHLVVVLKWILRNVFAQEIEGENSLSEIFQGYQRGALKRLAIDNLEVLGYKASPAIVLIFCALIILISYCSYQHDSSYFWSISDREIVVLAHTIVAFWILDRVLPLLVFHFMNFVIRMRASVMRMRVNF